MKKNLGSADRVVRILVAIIIAGLYFENVISGAVVIILLILAGIFIATSFVSFCPIYWMLGISSRKKAENG